jgi:hypothetical protein
MEALMVMLKRTNNGSEQFEIPDSSPYKEAIEIYKMEYEKAVQRYNDLYNSAWTNFSYMALVAGGLLTFGGARFVTPLTAFLACLPLLFWWVATFEPLNRYGDMVQKELGDIEKALNALCISEVFPEEAQKGLSHFRNFASREHDKSRKRVIVEHGIALLIFLPILLVTMDTFLRNDAPPLMFTAKIVGGLVIVSFIGQLMERRFKAVGTAVTEMRRVRNRVRIAAAVILIAAICFGLRVYRIATEGGSLTVPQKAAESESKD